MPSKLRTALAASSLFVALFTLASVWWPLLWHYRVAARQVAPAEVVQARKLDNSQALQELSGYDYNPGSRDKVGDIVSQASKALDGAWQISPTLKLGSAATFAETNMDLGPDRWQLYYAGLAIPKILLEAYEKTSDNRYFDAAQKFIVDFSAFESQAVLPKGFLWNDHAIAARVVVLAKFWQHYKDRPDFDVGTAHLLLTHVVRSVAFLADSRHYTYATNHGFMQSLGILHACVAFGTALCGAENQWLALQRLEEQLKYYVNAEGVILEHSAGYQRFGLVLFGYLLRYMDFLAAQPPADWPRKYAKAKAVYAALRRPDGSLPMLGDTSQETDSLGPELVATGPVGQLVGPMAFRSRWRPDQAHGLYPAAGLLVWWNGLEFWPNPTDLNQTVITWSYYPGHGHKHADETSVLFWANGERWWTAPGYTFFPPNQADLGPWGHTSSWEAANAPHLIGERPESDRTSRLLGYAWSASAAVVDLERSDGRGFRARRQMIYLAPNTWIALDHFSDEQDRRVRTIWQSDADKFHAQSDATPFRVLTSERSGRQMLVGVFGAPEPAVRSVRGAIDPYAGWVLSALGDLVPSPALVLEQRSNDAWTGMVWSLRSDASAPAIGRPDMASWNGPDSWTLVVPYGQGTLQLNRDNDRLEILRSSPNGEMVSGAENLAIEPPPDVQSDVQEARRTFAAAASSYGARFRSLVPYRWKATYALLAAFLVQELILLILGRFFRRFATALRLATMPLWLVIIVWLIPAYFGP